MLLTDFLDAAGRLYTQRDDVADVINVSLHFMKLCSFYELEVKSDCNETDFGYNSITVQPKCLNRRFYSFERHTGFISMLISTL